jgi:cell division protease FtsH
VQAMTTLESGTAIEVQYPEQETRAVAIHEAGHATTSHVYRKDLESSRLSVRMRGGSLGHHSAFERQERFHYWRSDEIGSLVRLLGAIAAEHVFYNQNSVGVSGDLAMATSQAASMVGITGMTPPWIDVGSVRGPDETEDEARARIAQRFENIGLALMNRTRGSADFHADPVAAVLGDAYKRGRAAQILGFAFITAYNFVRANREGVERVADRLVEEREIYGDALLELLDEQDLRYPELDYAKDETWPKM